MILSKQSLDLALWFSCRLFHSLWHHTVGSVQASGELCMSLMNNVQQWKPLTLLVNPPFSPQYNKVFSLSWAHLTKKSIFYFGLWLFLTYLSFVLALCKRQPRDRCHPFMLTEIHRSQVHMLKMGFSEPASGRFLSSASFINQAQHLKWS